MATRTLSKHQGAADKETSASTSQQIIGTDDSRTGSLASARSFDTNQEDLFSSQISKQNTYKI